MFNKGTFRKEATPKRVLAMLKLIDFQNNKYKKEDIFNYIQPAKFYDSKIDQKESSLVFRLCINEGFIRENTDKTIGINIERKYINDDISFRKYINLNLFEDGIENKFYIITEKILQSDLNLYEYKSFKELPLYFRTEGISEEDILCWRFWASFLGYGFILNKQFVVNPYIRLKDIIEEKFINKHNKQILFKEFILELSEYCPEINKSILNNELSIPLSMALKTLHKLNIIKLIEIKDSEDRWNLNFDDSKEFITHIQIV